MKIYVQFSGIYCAFKEFHRAMDTGHIYITPQHNFSTRTNLFREFSNCNFKRFVVTVTVQCIFGLQMRFELHHIHVRSDIDDGSMLLDALISAHRTLVAIVSSSKRKRSEPFFSGMTSGNDFAEFNNNNNNQPELRKTRVFCR